MTCPEDESINRMEESLDLWERTVNDSNFEKVAFILTFTKEDLFEQKLKKRNLKNYFTDYDGNEDPIIAIDFITKLFISKNKFKNTRRVYTISVNATDTQATIKSLIAVKDAILLQAEVKERKHTRSKSGSKGGHRRTKSQF
jgi:GTPase SAR1 family protein